MKYNLINKDTRIKDLQFGIWYYIKPEFDHSNEVTAIQYDGEKVYLSFIGGEFQVPFTFWFKLSKDAANEIWQYDFKEDYPRSFDEETTLLEISEISTTPYTMLMDLDYHPNLIGNIV